MRWRSSAALYWAGTNADVSPGPALAAPQTPVAHCRARERGRVAQQLVTSKRVQMTNGTGTQDHDHCSIQLSGTHSACGWNRGPLIRPAGLRRVNSGRGQGRSTTTYGVESTRGCRSEVPGGERFAHRGGRQAIHEVQAGCQLS
jgi:hypothetical protein